MSIAADTAETRAFVVADGANTATSAWLARDHAALAGVLSRAFAIVADRGVGAWITDVEGRRYLDLTMGIGVNNIGHCHPEVVAAAERQLRTLMHTSVVTHQQRNVELAERLARFTPFFAEPQVFFCNTGAEAVDGAVKLARKVTHRPGLIAFRGGFHGRTIGATSLTTAKAKYNAEIVPRRIRTSTPYCGSRGRPRRKHQLAGQST